MELQVWQIIALTILSMILIWDSLSTAIFDGKPMFAGILAGIIMGDITTGLAVGATLQLMVLGVGTYGGSSMPDYLTGAIVGTVFAVTSGQGVEFGIGLAVPVGLLMVNLDVLARFCNVFFAKRVEAAIDRLDYPGIKRNIWFGMIPWGLSRALPVFIMLIFGEDIVNAIVNHMPEWLTGGLSVAGGLLPAVGIAILLRYLPVKKYISFLLLGFFLAAYLSVPMVGVAIFGVAMAVIEFKKSVNGNQVVAAANAGGSQEGLLDGEYED